MWCIKSRYGYVQKMTAFGAVSRSKEEREIWTSLPEVLKALNKARETCPVPGFYTLVRLSTSSQRLKRQLLKKSEHFERNAVVDVAGEQWHKGYARALRDVAAQL